MSSDPTQPVPPWWEQPQDPERMRGYRAGRGYQASDETQRLPASQRYGPGDQSGRSYQGAEATQRYPADRGFRGRGYRGPAPRMRRRRRKWPIVTLIVIIVLLVAGDRVARAVTQDQMASQMQSSLELSGKPRVTIQGFPFLTQLAARDFRTVNVNASNETAGPAGQLEIASLAATLHGLHINGLNSATIDQFNASALITFTALGKAGGIPDSVRLSAAGPNRIKASVDILGFSGSAEAEVTKAGPGQIRVQVVDAGGLPAQVLGNLNFTVSIPKLPAGVAIQNVGVTPQGVLITAVGHNTTLSR